VRFYYPRPSASEVGPETFRLRSVRQACRDLNTVILLFHTVGKTIDDVLLPFFHVTECTYSRAVNIIALKARDRGQVFLA
jgi:hypothetical protein